MKSEPETRARNCIGLAAIVYLAYSAWACSFNITQAVDTLIPIINGLIPIAAAAASALLPAEAAAINAAVPLVTNGLKELNQAVDSYHANPSDTALQKVADVCSDVHSNLSGLLSAAQVKNPAVQAKVTSVVNLAAQTISAVESWLAQEHAQKAAKS
jgi:hypothetical protein